MEKVLASRVVGAGGVISQLRDEKWGGIDGSIVSIEKSEQLHTEGVSPGVCIRPGVVVHSLQVVVNVAFTVEIELIVDVDLETDTEADTTCVLLGVSSAIAVAVVTLTLVEVSSVVSVQVSVVDDVVTVVSVETQVVLTVMDNVTAVGREVGKAPDNTVRFPVGKGRPPEKDTEAIGPVINVEFALSDVAATDELVGIMEVPVGSISVLVLLSGSSMRLSWLSLGLRH